VTVEVAVQDRDRAAIASMTRFPFVVRMGNADPNDSMCDYDRKAFMGVLDRLLLLRGNCGFPSQASNEPSMFQVIASGKPDLACAS
jgi:hypothetical protein